MEPLHLCATTRLAQALRARPPAAGAAVWRTCQALTVGAWLARLQEEAVLTGAADPVAALDPQAERLLWERVIADSLDPGEAPLFDIPGLAAAAAEAHALAQTWNLAPAGPVPEETRRFLDWQREFTRRCQARGWVSGPRLQSLTVTLVEAGKVPVPGAVRFAGFDRHSPLEERLAAALRSRGVTVDELPDPDAPGAAAIVPCPDRSAELQAVAAWARAHLAANPAARLGIVAPDLANLRTGLEFALDDALHPEALRPGAAGLPRAYNISLGQPLSAQPLVRTALDLIALGPAREVEQARLSALLLSPYWSGGEGEANARARVDAALREELEFFTGLPALIRLCKRVAARDGVRCPRLIRHLEDFVAAVEAAGSKRRLPSAWGEAFAGWLAALHWPGDRALSSDEYQCRQAFAETLDSLSRCDDILGPVGAGEALGRLSRLCGERLFQPETRGRPAIQVLGVLESAGLEFDALWVLGMNDHAWPPAPRPNPLLPAEVQRRAASPHASAEVELAFASAVHRRLLRAAPEVVFSWSRMEGDRPLRPSPLIAGLPSRECDAPAAAPAAAPPLERLADAQAPAVAEGEKVSGGTGLLKAQAICPAWAYYQYRVGGRALKTAVEGLDPMARGTLAHGALEHFWRATETQARLLALDAPAREAAIAAAVAAALADFEAATHRELPPRYRALEGGRLCRLLAAWLEVESRRPPFAVAACEQEAVIDIEGIRVRTIIDRIDRLPDGRLIILDYKTGRSLDTKNWGLERITEPQLPIYAALAQPEGGDPVAGVAFAQVLPDKPAFAGVGEEKALLPGIAGLDDDKRKTFPAEDFPDWPSLLAHWRDRLTAVAAEVKAGEAAVRFADEGALRYCEVLPLLRLAERRQQLEESQ